MYSEDQYKYGISLPAFANQERNQSISRVDEINHKNDFLSIACTQLLVEDNMQKKIVNEWIEIIPDLNARFLEFRSHVPQKLLNAIFENEGLKGLSIKWTKAKSIEGIGKLNKLEFLNLGNSPSIENFELIGDLDKLKILTIENLKKANDYSFLSSLSNLEFLSIEGGMNSKPKIRNLTFVKKLNNLRRLSLVAMKLDDKDLTPLLELKKLKSFNWPYKHTQNELKLLRNNIPSLIYDFEFWDAHVKKNLEKLN